MGSGAAPAPPGRGWFLCSASCCPPNPAPPHALTQEGSSPHTSTRTHSQLSSLIPGAVRSPPGLAKTPLSALGLKPHNPADILLHPTGGE